MKNVSTKRFARRFTALVALLLIPFLLVFAFAFLLPPVYEDTYVGELKEKVDRLKNTEGERIVIIGGSSVAFGIDSHLMEEHLGKPVVNFGLYADLGTKVMLDLARPYLHEGDVVILAPEINAQTLSTYFGGETMWQATDADRSLLFSVAPENIKDMVGGAFPYLANKISYLLAGAAPSNTGAYRKECFNDRGDNDFDRPYNVDPILHDVTFDPPVDPLDGVTSPSEEFIEKVNSFIAAAKRKGATVYWSFPPINEKAVTASEDGIRAFYTNLRDALDCEIISNPFTYIMDEGYFFDSEFHANNAGRTVHTVHLIDDVKRTAGDTSVTVALADLPAPPGFDPYAGEIEDADASDYILEGTTVSGKEVYRITGLSETGKTKTKLVIPLSTDGTPIAVIGADAFSGGAVTEIVVSRNITAIEGYALRGANALRTLTMPAGKAPNDVVVPNNMGGAALFTDGAPATLRIRVDQTYYAAFAGDYFWGDYASRLDAYDPETR